MTMFIEHNTAYQYVHRTMNNHQTKRIIFDSTVRFRIVVLGSHNSRDKNIQGQHLLKTSNT